ncbi:hypothetical protein [Spartinivicinus ruber]|uniref:hypothetical protein n=1 Tax=Spartinivicinus ruber TaxID=2683272 RepID=UPI0013D422D7|nr:hypothetical protein [Spartinivicinus ruber]
MAMTGLEIDVSQTMDLATESLLLTPKQLEKAANRAAVKACQWLRTHSAREIGQTLNIKRSVLKQRMKIYPRYREGQVKFWVGLNRIGAHRLGNPTVAKQGVKVGRRYYAGAFIEPMRSDQLLVFKRKPEARYAQGRDSQGRLRRHRLPIELVSETIEAPALDIIQQWERRVLHRFQELLDHEVEALINGHVT